MQGQIDDVAYQAGLFDWQGCKKWDCQAIADAALDYYKECSHKTNMAIRAYVHGAMRAIEAEEKFW